MGSDVRHWDWLVLDVACRHRFVLMQVEGTRNGIRLAVGALVRSSISSAGDAVSALHSTLRSSLALVLLITLLSFNCSCCHMVRVVFLNVLQQVRLRCVRTIAKATGVDLGMLDSVRGHVDF